MYLTHIYLYLTQICLNLTHINVLDANICICTWRTYIYIYTWRKYMYLTQLSTWRNYVWTWRIYMYLRHIYLPDANICTSHIYMYLTQICMYLTLIYVHGAYRYIYLNLWYLWTSSASRSSRTSPSLGTVFILNIIQKTAHFSLEPNLIVQA